ncbi:hypothetical protein DBR06_SOUSAS1510020, partial [Sousa chinensis]
RLIAELPLTRLFRFSHAKMSKATRTQREDTLGNLYIVITLAFHSCLNVKFYIHFVESHFNNYQGSTKTGQKTLTVHKCSMEGKGIVFANGYFIFAMSVAEAASAPLKIFQSCQGLYNTSIKLFVPLLKSPTATGFDDHGI